MGITPTEHDMDLVRTYTMLGDIVADAYAALIPKFGPGRLIQMLQQACDQGVENVPGAPPELVAFLRDMERIPDWVDMDLVREGARLDLNATANISPFAIRGAVWYQGEANIKDGYGYFAKLKSLIEGWRDDWQQGDFAFLVVQLASIGESKAENPAMDENRARIREAQLHVLREIPNTGVAAAIDTGGPKEHPPNKFETSFRLAQWALHHLYGRKEIVPSGPIYRDSKVEGRVARVRFDNANGLMIANKQDYQMPVAAPDAKLPWLSLQAKDGSWHWADARIAGTDLLVSSSEVAEPVAVRYAWVNRPLGPYLYNAAGLPAFPFTTESWQP